MAKSTFLLPKHLRLNSGDVIRVVAYYPGQGSLLDLGQLILFELDIGVEAVLVKEAIAQL